MDRLLCLSVAEDLNFARRTILCCIWIWLQTAACSWWVLCFVSEMLRRWGTWQVRQFVSTFRSLNIPSWPQPLSRCLEHFARRKWGTFGTTEAGCLGVQCSRLLSECTQRGLAVFPNPRRNCTFGRFGHVVGAVFLFEKLLQGAFLPGLFPGNSWGMRFGFFVGWHWKTKITIPGKKICSSRSSRSRSRSA